MPRKTATPTTTPATKEAAPTPARAAKPKSTQSTVVVEIASKPRAAQRVTSVKHSKAAVPVAVEAAAVDVHEQIAKIAYGYWEARGFQPGSPEQDWLRAEQQYLLQA